MTPALGIEQMTEDGLASWLISTVRLHGGQMHTALLVAGTFMADEMIRERFHPDWVASEREAAETKRLAYEAKERRRHAPWTPAQRAACDRRRTRAATPSRPAEERKP